MRGRCNICINALVNLICVSYWVQYTRVHMILEVCISFVPKRNIVND
jgi:hypothetical protein